MALDLFKRVETRKGLFAVEKITLIYNLLTSILILFLFQEMDHPVQMLADRAVIAGMTFLLMYLYRLAPCKFSAFIRIVIQMSLLSYWYPDTFEFNRIFPNLDHICRRMKVKKLDRKSTRLNSSHASKSRMPSSA